MQFPIVHLGGTNGKDLVEQNLEVLAALRQTQRKMQQASPNGRDYYVRRGALTVAETEYKARMVRIEDTILEYEAIVEDLMRQIDEIEAIKRGAYGSCK